MKIVNGSAVNVRCVLLAEVELILAGENCHVRAVVEGDLPQIAELHRKQFPGHFLGQLPADLLARFYSSFIGGSIFLVAASDGKIMGFVMGGSGEVLQLRRRLFLRSSWFQLAVGLAQNAKLWAPTCSRLPALVLKKSHCGFRSSAEWRLLSIAVDDEAKGAGVAAILVREFESHLSGVERYGLSVLGDNARAIRFYDKMGFSEEGRHAGSVFFVKSCSEVGSR